MLIEAEAVARRDRKVTGPVREARFKLPSVCIEDVVCLPDCKPICDRIARLTSCDRIEDRKVVIIISKAGCGKSFIGQALDNAAYRRLLAVRHTRLADVMEDLNRYRVAGDGSHCGHMDSYKRTQPSIVDGFTTAPVSTQNAAGLFETMGRPPSSPPSPDPASGVWESRAGQWPTRY